MILNTLTKSALLIVALASHVSADYFFTTVAQDSADATFKFRSHRWNSDLDDLYSIETCWYSGDQPDALVSYIDNTPYNYILPSPQDRCDDFDTSPRLAVVNLGPSATFLSACSAFEIILENAQTWGCYLWNDIVVNSVGDYPRQGVYYCGADVSTPVIIPASCTATTTTTTTSATTTTTTTSATTTTTSTITSTITTTTTPTSTATSTTTKTTTTTAVSTCISGYKGLKNGKGPLNSCCITQRDCINECINGKCNRPDGKTTNTIITTTTKKPTTTTTKTTTTTTKTAVPTCIAGYKGTNNGKGPLNACCTTERDCINECINGKCNSPGGKTTTTTKKTTTTTAKPTTTAVSCTSGYNGKKNGNGPKNACCTTQWDCINDCINGKCNV